MFTNKVETVSKQATKAVSVFESTHAQLASAVDKFKAIIVSSYSKIATHEQEIMKERETISAAQAEVTRTEAVMAKISGLLN